MEDFIDILKALFPPNTLFGIFVGAGAGYFAYHQWGIGAAIVLGIVASLVGGLVGHVVYVTVTEPSGRPGGSVLSALLVIPFIAAVLWGLGWVFSNWNTHF